MKREYWKYFKVTFPYLRRRKGLVAAMIGLMIVSAVAALADPWPLALLVDDVLGGHAPPGPVVALAGRSQSHLIVFAVVAGFVVTLVIHAIGVISEYVTTRLDQEVALDFRSDLFAHCQRLSQGFHDDTTTGDSMYRINFEAKAVGEMSVALPPLAQSVLTLIGMFVIALRIDPTLALISLVAVPFVSYSTSYYGKHIEPKLITVRDLESKSLTIVNDTFNMLRVICAFNREDHEHRLFQQQGRDAVNARVNITVRQTLFSLAVALSTAAGIALILGFGANDVLHHRLTAGQLLVVLAYIHAIYGPLSTISSTLASFQNHLIGIRYAQELLDVRPDVADLPGSKPLGRARGDIELRGVHYAYSGRPAALRNVSFRVGAGEVVGIVGPTGAGKSTLVSLLPRFLDPSDGTVLIDGRDLRTLTVASVRDQVSLVQQEPLLFPRSIGENIRYGRLDASDEEVIEAARAANAHDFIAALPEGYATKLGERGAKISGGERQRIAMARAFLKDAPVLILDEPTSSIDSRTEAAILDSLELLMEGRTTLIVAHRLSTLRRADRVIVINDGEVVEQGTHESLVAQGGLYTLLNSLQGGAPDRGQHGRNGAGDAGAGWTPPAPPSFRAQSPAVAAMAKNGRPKVVVLGMMSKIPVAGVVWQTLHYLIGFERLGLDAYYVEAHARTPSMLMTNALDDSSALAADFIGSVLRRHGLGHRWAFQALHSDARCYGLSAGALERLYRDAALIVNLHGGTLPLPEHVATGRLVYLETDPVQPQIEVFDHLPETIDFLDQHCAHFTFAENYGKPGCTLPRTDRYHFRPTRQPVVLDWWDGAMAPADGRFTTVANWCQPWRDVRHDGRVYGWTKDDEFRRVIDLPAATSICLELALANCGPADEAALVDHGWRVRSAAALSGDIESYRRYIRASRGEFTVAKEQNVAFRTGWFSDRSATYLAAGRPVVMQDTGFGVALPIGRGLLAYSTPEEAGAALEAVRGDYDRHAAGARELARSHFSHEVVLGDLLAVLDVHGRPGHRRQRARGGDDARALPGDLIVEPVSKRPMRLDPATVDLLAGRRRAGICVAPRPAAIGRPDISIVVPVHDRVELTQLCLESVLGEPCDAAYEIVVVDDASNDETPDYLVGLALEHPQVRVVTNEECRGFARSVNRGVFESRGRVVIVANNDIIATRGWMAGLVAHLDDPAVGLVVASTAAHSRNCRVAGEYRTYDELQLLAAERRTVDPMQRPLTMAPLFCAALRREVLDEIGPLDEQFDVAMFEDDDYCVRLERAGYAMVCALDVFVHHYGEGTLGELYSDGAFHEVFLANRARFERKWNRIWDPSEDYDDPAYRAQVDAIRALLTAAIPAGEVVAVVSRGDDDLVDLDGPEGRHLPRTTTGAYLGAHPADSFDAVAQIESARAGGARWLFLPRPSGWWLDHYDTLAAHLAGIGSLAHDDELGWLYRLDPPTHTERTDVGPAQLSTDASPVASACTIISRNYLGQARVLARSYLTHHPEGRFYLLIVDKLPAGADLDPRIRLVDAADLPLDDLYDMCFKYDVVELATAVKPALLILLMERYREQRVMYIDPDILITRPMTEVFEALDHSDIVLTPHLDAPIPNDGRTPREQDILISGAYNLGFIALRHSDESTRLLGWWRERLNDLCRVDPANGLMVDQRWIDLVPSLFPSTLILRDDTYNVAYWNLHARRIERVGDGYTCNGRPLAMFHFSGYNPERPDVISKHQTRTELTAGSPLRDLFDAYGQAMRDAGFIESKAWGYGLNEFDNGIGLHAIFRRLYHELGDERRRFGDPFATGGDASFYAWATTADPERRSLSPFLEMAYRLRYDVQGAFPDVGGVDRAGFLAWAAGQGAAEFGFEPDVVHRCRSVSHSETTAPAVPIAHELPIAPVVVPAVSQPDPSPSAPTVRPTAPGALPGVNVCGYLRNESGLGAAARTYIRILEHLGVPLALRDISELSVNRSEDDSIGAFHDDHTHPVNLVCVNADQHFVVMAKDPDFFAGKYNIGVWFWELPSFPDKWRDRFAHYDEIWVGSSYIANTLAPLSPVPVVRIPPVLASEVSGDRERGRALIGAGDEFVFLFMFDFNSYIERKNPMAVIEAFRKAFPADERARLVIKSVNGAFNTAGLAALEAAASNDSRITLLGEYVSAGAIADLTHACDCYVSLHRAEGTGITMANAMAAAKPVIATGWSGNTDFMDASNSLLVRFDLVELDRDIGPYKLGGTWADPDVEHAAALMRHVFDRPDEAGALGAAAQRAIATRFSAERVGQVAGERLQVIAQRLQARAEGGVTRPLPLVAREHGGNAALMGAIRHIVAREVDDERPVVVVSKGDPVLVDLGDQPAWHYPQDDDGVYAGYYPADSATAIAHLERLRERGAGHFLVPATCGWWLHHYRELREHLDSHYQLAAEDASCVLYRLDPLGAAVVPTAAATAPVAPGARENSNRLDEISAQIEHLRATLAATGAWVGDLAPRVAATHDRVAAIPGVLRDAFTTVSAAVAAVEGDVDGRIEGIERDQERLAGLLTGTHAKLEEFAAHVEASRQLVETRQRQLEARLAELAQRAGGQAGEIGGHVTALDAHVVELIARVGAIEQQRATGPRSLPAGPPAETAARPGELEPAMSDRSQAAARNAVPGAAVTRVEYTASAGQQLAARPYMSTDRFSTGDPDQPLGFSRGDGREDERAQRPTFADVFRGDRSFITDRQRVYLPFFRQCRQVVDLGSGRGEFLDLLAEAGITAVGVEQDGSLARACRRRGLVVREQDALEFLEEIEPAGLDGVFSAQFIEHVEPARLGDLLVLARRALRQGGTFIAETVNPENPDALKTFHVDLTHQRPIFPQVLLHLCWEAGFDAAWIFYPLGGGFTQRGYDAVGEYAVVARA